MNKLKQLAVKLEREQTYEPLDTLFLIRKKGSKIIQSYGYGELKSRFMEGLPLTDEVPYGKRRKKPAMPVVQKDAVIELLTPGKDNFSFGVGSGRTLAEQQKSQLENLQIAINSPDVNVQVLHESPSPHQPQQIEPPQQIEQQQTQQIEPQQTQQIEPQQHEHDEQHLAQQRKTARKRLYEESFKQRKPTTKAVCIPSRTLPTRGASRGRPQVRRGKIGRGNGRGGKGRGGRKKGTYIQSSSTESSMSSESDNDKTTISSHDSDHSPVINKVNRQKDKKAKDQEMVEKEKHQEKEKDKKAKDQEMVEKEKHQEKEKEEKAKDQEMVEKEKDQEKEKEEKEKDQEKEKEEKEKDQEEVEKDVTEENAIVQEEEETHYEEVLPDDSFSYAATLTEELGNPIVQDLLQLKMNTEEGILEFDMSKEDDIKIGHYVAVAYESEWFAGLVTEKLNDTFKINFLKKISTGNDYKWPSKEDTSCVRREFIFDTNVELTTKDSYGRIWHIKQYKEIQEKFLSFCQKFFID